MLRNVLAFGLFVCAAARAEAQPVSTLLKNAEREASAGRFLAAAELWERAGRLKNADPALLYQAAEAYARARDYHRAADGYREAVSHPKFPLAGLRFARALKQQGRYTEAATAFENFAQGYRGEHKAVLMSVADNEIEGCLLAAQLLENQDTTTKISALPDSLNSPENDFSPIPFTDDLLYFSQSSEPSTRFMRSIRKMQVWGTSQEVNSLPPEVLAKFRSGCFSPDGHRFYYSECAGNCVAQQGGGAQAAECALFCLRRTEDGWAAPERLPAYVNAEGSTAMFPHIAHSGGVEYLFFSSNRPGTLGGLDIYVCERLLESETLDFSFPKNLGRAVNTGADEVTPFFDPGSETLWFSSLGHPSMGGLDVFKTQREGSRWTKPQNAGSPINSPADDCFFVLKKSGEGAFFSSNRTHPDGKVTTHDDDIFELSGW